MKFKIIPLVLSKAGIDKSMLTYFSGFGELLMVPIACWYIKGGEENILVDTGAEAKDMQKYWPAPAEHVQTFEQALKKVGLEPKDISKVIMTHLHFDHACNIKKCKNAEIIVHKKELEFAKKPHPLFAGLYPKGLYDGIKFKTVTGDKIKIIQGINAIYTPGHSPGNLSVEIRTPQGNAIICGFCTTAEAFSPPAGTPWPVLTPGIHTNPIDAFDSVLKIKKAADIPIIPHDLGIGSKKKIP